MRGREGRSMTKGGEPWTDHRGRSPLREAEEPLCGKMRLECSGKNLDQTMEAATSDSVRPSGDEVADADEGRKPPDQAEAKSNGSNRRRNRGPLKRTSWNRSLSLRGRESIVFAGGQYLKAKRKQRGGWKNQKKVPEKLYDFSKEKAYFEEVDAFELLEESPTPNKFSWKIDKDYEFPEHDLAAILARWRRSKLFSERCSGWPLSKIMETIPLPSGRTSSVGSFNCGIACSLSQIRETTAFELSKFNSNGSLKKPTDEPPHSEVASNFAFEERGIFSGNVSKNLIGDFSAGSVLSTFSALRIRDGVASSDKCEGAVLAERYEDEVGEFGGMNDIDGLSPWSCEEESLTAFEQLLMVCRQKAPVNLSEIFLKYW
ncbi:hypothetical protein KSP40_PGU022382 [Platanthera guangdongensis]|uniref:Uncharacterized protein n=1 Tax=Platanthera guangdongensis TaxID=2320717 RepID=A0ABR2LGW0_9ASPA